MVRVLSRWGHVLKDKPVLARMDNVIALAFATHEAGRSPGLTVPTRRM